MADKNINSVDQSSNYSSMTKFLVSENGTLKRLDMNKLLGKIFSVHTTTTEIINNTGYHGVKTSTLQNDYSDLFQLASDGNYITYTGDTPCIISGVVKFKAVKNTNDYVHVFTGKYYSDSNEAPDCSMLTPFVDTSGRWYTIPFMFTVKNGESIHFLYTHSSSAYIKIEVVDYKFKIDSFVV